MLRGHKGHCFLAVTIIHFLLGYILCYFEESPLSSHINLIHPSPFSAQPALAFFLHLRVDMFLSASEPLQFHPSNWEPPSLTR